MTYSPTITRMFMVVLADVKGQHAGYWHPLVLDVYAAQRMSPAIDDQVDAIARAPNRNADLIPTTRNFLLHLFPSGVTPSGTRVDEAGIRSVANTCFALVC